MKELLNREDVSPDSLAMARQRVERYSQQGSEGRTETISPSEQTIDDLTWSLACAEFVVVLAVLVLAAGLVAQPLPTAHEHDYHLFFQGEK